MLLVEETPELPLQEPNGGDDSHLDSETELPRRFLQPFELPNPSSSLSSAQSMPDPFNGVHLSHSQPRVIGGKVEQNDIIDLTIPSDPPAPDTPGYDSDPYINVRTPPLNPLNDNPFRDSKKPRIEFRVPPMPSTVINLESESSSTTKEEKHSGKQEELPDFSEVERISRLNASYLVERQDRKRLLIRYIHRLTPVDRQGIVARTVDVTLKESQDEVWSGLAAIKSHAHKMRGADPKTSDDIMRIAQLYVCWSQNTKHSPHGFPRRCVERTIDDVAGFECFYTFLCESLARYENEIAEEPVTINSTPEKATYRLGKRKYRFEDEK